MIILVSKIVFLLSLLGLLFIICRKLPSLSRLPEDSTGRRISISLILIGFKNIIRRIASSHFFQNVFLGNLEKSLRRFKIAALKADNIIDKFIRKLKKGSGEGTPS